MADGGGGIFADLPPVPEEAVADAAALDTLLRTATRPFVVRINDTGGDVLALIPPPPKKRGRRTRSSDAVVGGGSGAPA